MALEVPWLRLLLVADDDARPGLRALVPAGRWDVVEASSIQQARFVQEAQPCDVAAVDGGLAGPGWGEALAWLAGQVPAPVVLVAGAAVEVVLEGLRQGASWLPADAARRHPELLAGLLEQAAWLGQERQRAGFHAAALRDSHARVDRLLGLLWEAVPGEGPARWLSQRHMLERLDEEVARTLRHGGPLSVVLGELCPDGGERLAPAQLGRLAGWMAGQVGRHKRRSDVAGQYGLGGFMLLLPRVGPAEAAAACRRLDGLLRHPAHEGLPAVHACFGLAGVPEDLPSVQVLLRRAEERLDQSREGAEKGLIPSRQDAREAGR
jgi:GGDEF domain-containing protein